MLASHNSKIILEWHVQNLRHNISKCVTIWRWETNRLVIHSKQCLSVLVLRNVKILLCLNCLVCIGKSVLYLSTVIIKGWWWSNLHLWGNLDFYHRSFNDIILNVYDIHVLSSLLKISLTLSSNLLLNQNKCSNTILPYHIIFA